MLDERRLMLKVVETCQEKMELLDVKSVNDVKLINWNISSIKNIIELLSV